MILSSRFALHLMLFITLAQHVCFSGTKIKLALEDSVFVTRQPIWMSATLKNELSEAIRYEQFRFEHDLKVIIEDSLGQKLLYAWLLETHGLKTHRLLQPGDELTNRANLLTYYGEYDQGLVWTKYLPAGRYSVTACLSNDSDTYYCSDAISIYIVEPRGSDRTQSELLIKARKANKEHQIIEAFKYYDQIETNYSGGKFVDLAIYECAVMAKPFDEKLSTQTYRRLIENHPNSNYAEDQLHGFIGYLEATGKRDDAMQFLRILSAKNPDTRVGVRARKLLTQSK